MLATQRPLVDVITGLIKPTSQRASPFQVASKIDSRTIPDQMGCRGAARPRRHALLRWAARAHPTVCTVPSLPTMRCTVLSNTERLQAHAIYRGRPEGTDAETLNEINGDGSNDGEKTRVSTKPLPPWSKADRPASATRAKSFAHRLQTEPRAAD